MESSEGGLTLELVFKISAVFLLIGGLTALFMPQFWFDPIGWEMTDELENMASWMGLTFVMVAILQWKIVDWGGDNLSQFGMYMAIWYAVFLAGNIYEVATGLHEAGDVMANIVPNAAFAGLFFWKSR